MWKVINSSEPLDNANGPWSYDESFSGGSPSNSVEDDLRVDGRILPDLLIVHYWATSIVGTGSIDLFMRVGDQGANMAGRVGFWQDSDAIDINAPGNSDIVTAAGETIKAVGFSPLKSRHFPLIHQRFYFQNVVTDFTSGRIRMWWEWVVNW